MTTADKILELIDKINQPVVEEKPAKEESPPTVEEPPAVEKIAEAVVTRKQKKKIANVVTNLIGYKLGTKI